MCKVPCWPSPEEAKQLIKLGYGPKLMIAGRRLPTKKDRYISILSPAKPGSEGRDNLATEGCVFQKKGLCELHNICKPLEGRLTICNAATKGREPVDLRDRVAELWDNKKAQLLVDKWIKEFGKGGEISWERINGGYVYLPG